MPVRGRACARPLILFRGNRQIYEGASAQHAPAYRGKSVDFPLYVAFIPVTCYHSRYGIGEDR